MYFSFRIRCCLLVVIFFIQLCYTTTAQQQQLQMEPGTCSKKCKVSTSNDDLQKTTSGTNSSFLFQCSCSPSCELYGDCCYDSPKRNSGIRKTKPVFVCLTLSGKGQFGAVAQCPPDWTGSSEFCKDGVGHLAPVTSRLSGITYANVFCALCNGEGRGLTTWPAELRCCPEHDSNNDVQFHYVYSRQYFWSVPESGSGASPCRCKYISFNNDSSFVESLELRPCQERFEISTCSFTWADDRVKELCSSYLDPVYLGDKVYRNAHCAQCNYEILADVSCKPAIVEKMLLRGATEIEIQEYCRAQGVQSCMHFFATSRGKMHPFSDMFTIHTKVCMPAPGERCCVGQRYDFRAKRCRKLTRRNN